MTKKDPAIVIEITVRDPGIDLHQRPCLPCLYFKNIEFPSPGFVLFRSRRLVLRTPQRVLRSRIGQVHREAGFNINPVKLHLILPVPMEYIRRLSILPPNSALQ